MNKTKKNTKYKKVNTKNTEKLSKKIKINKLIKVNFKLTTKYKKNYKYNIEDCNDSNIYNKCRKGEEQWKIVDILPNKIINYIQYNKEIIKDNLFYDTYICCGSSLNKYKSFEKPHKITFFSKKKILSIYFILPKNTNYNDIKKIIINQLKDKYGIIELKIKNLDLYKFNNKFYIMDWKLNNIELINNKINK